MGCNSISETPLDLCFRILNVIYTQLLKAASAAEIESERGRVLGIHSKGGNLITEDPAVETLQQRCESNGS